MAAHTFRKGFVGVLLAGGAALSTVSVAGAAPSGATGATGASLSTGFLNSRATLEVQLTERSTRLGDLATDVSKALSLTGAHSTLLSARIATEQTSISGLVLKVPSDTTWAQLNADRAAMLKDNRVFAVMSPQVFETIEGDAILAQATSLGAEQATLLSEVNSLAGQPGSNNAIRHYKNFVDRLSGVTTSIAATEAVVLEQTPQGYPRNTHVFVHANSAMLKGDLALAYASYDASVIGLATGGYTGP